MRMQMGGNRFWNVLGFSRIPSFKDAFTSSLSKQKLNPGINLGRRRVQHFFFHGAANGSMGFFFRVQYLELISITEEPSSMTILNLMGFGNLG
jgi:hypothetical protein